MFDSLYESDGISWSSGLAWVQALEPAAGITSEATQAAEQLLLGRSGSYEQVVEEEQLEANVKLILDSYQLRLQALVGTIGSTSLLTIQGQSG
jgi:hypothetical protein